MGKQRAWRDESVDYGKVGGRLHLGMIVNCYEFAIAQEMNYVPNAAGKALAFSKNPVTFGIVMPPKEIRFFDEIRDGIQAAADELKDFGVRLEYLYVDNKNPEEGAVAIRQLVKSGVSGIMFSGMDDPLIRESINQAAKEGVPVITFNSDVENSKRISVANRSVGIKQGADLAKMELQLLLAQYQLIKSKFDELDTKLDELIGDIPGVNQLLAIKGIGRDTVAGFIAEVGDISNYHHPKQIIKLAGLSLQENTSGRHKGQTKITKRGRKKLRDLLFRVVMPLVAKNQAFKALHEYYTKRPDNPLKKMQSLIALCNKLIRILFGIMKKGHEFSSVKMLQDIPRFASLPTAA
jgi:hypothetical protein